MFIRDTIIPQSQVVPGDPRPAPTINPLVRTADKAAEDNPTGQYTRMLAYAQVMNDTTFIARADLPLLFHSRIASLMRKMYQAGSFDSMLQTMTYMQDKKFIGFVVDPTMRARFQLAAASKAITLMPDLYQLMADFVIQVDSVRQPAQGVATEIRTTAADEPLIRSALVFQPPSMYQTAANVFAIYHITYLLCRALNGFDAIIENSIRDRIEVVKLKEMIVKFTDEMFKMPGPLAFFWNLSLSAVSNVDVPTTAQIALQNLNPVIYTFESLMPDTWGEYENIPLRQFKRPTDQRTPNWMTPQRNAMPVSKDAVDYTAKIVETSLRDLRTLVYSKEV